jgi:hypothetical protein
MGVPDNKRPRLKILGWIGAAVVFLLGVTREIWLKPLAEKWVEKRGLLEHPWTQIKAIVHVLHLYADANALWMLAIGIGLGFTLGFVIRHTGPDAIEGVRRSIPWLRHSPSVGRRGRALLKAAAKDPAGAITVNRDCSPPALRSSLEDFGGPLDPAKSAQWLEALMDLTRRGLMADRLGRGEVYQLTAEGYEAAGSRSYAVGSSSRLARSPNTRT